MDSHPGSRVRYLKNGLRRIRTAPYVLFVDSTTARHLIHEYPCDLVMLGDSHGPDVNVPKGFGFAFR